ncbi:MAG TPA: MarR family transcriptional regulator [Methylocella sp.]|nr:MarR family transcriptional regulator [Methylocella sp.]
MRDLAAAGRRHSDATVMLHSAIAQRFDLTATDLKALGVLDQLGALTAGELAQQTGLATASVTSLIDRLEKRGFVHRRRDQKDRRKVFVEIDRAALAPIARIYDKFDKHFEPIFAGFDASALEIILTFLHRARECAHALTKEISREGH